jgi:hypothetical protein
LACNHCTGVKAVEAMIGHGSTTDRFVGNGDVFDVSAD